MSAIDLDDFPEIPEEVIEQQAADLSALFSVVWSLGRYPCTCGSNR